MNLYEQASFVLVPSAHRYGKVYPQKPEYTAEGDLTFTRASTATQVNSSGLIETSPRNLLQRSEEVDNGSWTKNLYTVSANVETAPNGTLTADKIVQTSSSGDFYINASATANIQSLFTYSIYVKKSDMRYFTISSFASSPNNFSYSPLARYDLDNGIVSIQNNCIGQIVNVGNGWYRCIMTTNQNYPITSASISFFLNDAGGNVPEIGKGTLLWGAQLEIGSTATPYVATTDRLNHPRIDHSSGVPALLLEPQRTNTILRSNDFLNATWQKTDVTVELHPTILSPDGTPAIIVKKNGSNSHVVQTGVTTSNSYIKSIYARTVSGVGKLHITGISIHSRYLVDISEQWTRYAFQVDTSETVGSFVYAVDFRGSESTLNEVLIYAAQNELGSYPTSYIPTTTATVTRVADSFTRNNVFTNGLISAQGGTWFVELVNNVPLVRDVGSPGIFLDTNVNGFSDGISISNQGGGVSNRISIRKAVPGFSVENLRITTTLNPKIVIKWNGTTADVFENGVKVVSATSFTPTAMEHLNCNSQDVPKYIKQMALWNKPLTDAQCEAISGFSLSERLLSEGGTTESPSCVESSINKLKNIQ